LSLMSQYNPDAIREVSFIRLSRTLYKEEYEMVAEAMETLDSGTDGFRIWRAIGITGPTLSKENPLK